MRWLGCMGGAEARSSVSRRSGAGGPGTAERPSEDPPGIGNGEQPLKRRPGRGKKPKIDGGSERPEDKAVAERE